MPGQAREFVSDEHFTVDGTPIEAWVSQKSFQKKDGSDKDDGSNFHGQQRRNDTHQSKTDPEARLYLGQVLVENHGLIVGAMATAADGFAERDAELLMVHDRRRNRKLIRSMGADKGYDTRDFVKALREMKYGKQLNREGCIRLGNLFRSVVVHRRKSGRQPQARITAAYLDSQAGMRAPELFEKRHSIWRRRQAARMLMDATRSRARRKAR